MPFTLTLAKCAPDKTQQRHSSSWSHILLCFSSCFKGHWEPFPITENLMENRSTLKYFPIMFIRLDIVSYGSPICCVLHQPQCLILMHLLCNPRTLLCQVFHKHTMEYEPLFTAGFVLPSASWIPGLQRQVNMGSSTHCAHLLLWQKCSPGWAYLMLFWAHCKAMFGPHPFEAPGFYPRGRNFKGRALLHLTCAAVGERNVIFIHLHCCGYISDSMKNKTPVK